MTNSVKRIIYYLLAVSVLTVSVVVFSQTVFADPVASWHMVNVNSRHDQGDANLLVVGDVTILIDAGYEWEAKKHLVPYLQKLGIKKIDHFFISHPHRDHYEGLAAILKAGIRVGKLYYKIPAADVRDCCYDKWNFLKYLQFAAARRVVLITPKTGFKLTLPHHSTLEILHAQEGNLPDKKVDVNDLSMVMKWKIAGSSVLFTGDLNHTIGEYLTGDPRMKSTFLKMPHHGGRGIAPNAFFETVDPSFVLVPGPRWVWCGERGDQPRQWTIAKGIPTWVNGINGTIRVDFFNNKTVISPEITSGECKAKAFGKISRPNSMGLGAIVQLLLK